MRATRLVLALCQSIRTAPAGRTHTLRIWSSQSWPWNPSNKRLLSQVSWHSLVVQFGRTLLEYSCRGHATKHFLGRPEMSILLYRFPESSEVLYSSIRVFICVHYPVCKISSSNSINFMLRNNHYYYHVISISVFILIQFHRCLKHKLMGRAYTSVCKKFFSLWHGPWKDALNLGYTKQLAQIL
jgi:hypothetical protein